MGASGALRARRPVQENWVTAADITGQTGTGNTISAEISLVHPTVYYSDMWAEVEFIALRTNATGSVLGRVRMNGFTYNTFAVTDKDTAGNLTTLSLARSDSVAIVRRVLIKPPIVQAGAGLTTNRWLVNVYCSGTDPATEYSLTGIRARIVYVPI